MKVVSHNERVGRPLLEYVLIGVALCLFLFGFWAYKQIDQAGKPDDSATNQVQLPPAGTTDEVDWVTEGEVTSERALDEEYDDDEASAGAAVDSAADDMGGIYDESAY